MANFVTDVVADSIETKEALRAIPSGFASKYFPRALEWNKLVQWLQDLRTFIRGREFNVKNYGATGDGVADDTAGIAAAAAAATGGILVFPKGSWRTSEPIDISSSCSVRIETGASVRATAAMDAVFRLPSDATASNKVIYGGGIINCDGLAGRGLWLKRFGHYTVREVAILSPTLYGVHMGTSTIEAFGAQLLGVHVQRASGSAVPAGSVGIYQEEGGDSSFIGCVVEGCETGFRLNGSQNRLVSCHGWTNPTTNPGGMTTCFDDLKSGNTYVGCYADTPTTYGWHFRSGAQNASLQGCKVFNNGDYGTDNTLVGIRFEDPAPAASLVGCHFRGSNGTHRIAKDIDASSFSDLTVLASQLTNVVTSQPARLGPGGVADAVGGAVRQSVRTATQAWTPSVITAGAFTSTTVSVPGAALGDVARACMSTAVPSGVQVTADVTSADTVTVKACSSSGVSQTIPSGTLRVVVERYA